MNVCWRSFILLFVFLFSAAIGQAASNQSLIYQGILTNNSDEPYTTSQSVEFSIHSPAPSDCLIYKETHNITPDSKGRFSVEIGTGVRTDSTGYSLHKIFVNGGTFSGLTCGGGGTSYTPSISDDRVLKIAVNGTAMSPSVPLKSVPFAMQAREVNGWGVDDIVKIHPSLGSATTFTTAEMAKVKSISGASCANNEILKWNGTAWACAADASGGTAAGDAGYGTDKGLVAFDTNAATSGITVSSGVAKLSNTGVTASSYGSATSVPTISVDAQGRITTASNTMIALPANQLTQSGANSGEVLKWNGTAWAPASDATGGAPGDASFASKGLVQGLTDEATSGLKFNSGVLSVNAGTGSNQIVKLNGSAQLPAVDGSLLTNLSVGNMASGVLPIARGGTNNGSLGVTAGGILYMDGAKAMTTAAGTSGQALISAGAGAPAFGTLMVAGGGTGATSFASNSVILANGTGSALTYLTCSPGQVLKWNLSGTAWECSADVLGTPPGDATYSSKGVVQVHTSAAASGLDLSAGVLKLATSGVSAGTYRSVTVDTFGRVTNATNPTTAAGYGLTDVFVNAGNSFAGPASLGTNDSNTLSFETNGTARMTIHATNGNIGIGTTPNTNDKVLIRSAATETGAPIKIQHMNTNGYVALDFVDSLGTSRGGVGFGNSGAPVLGNLFYLGTVDANDLIIRTDDSERIRVKATGEVGIGTDAPAATLDVNGSVAVKATYEEVPISVNSTTAYTIPDTTLNIRRITLTANTTITLPAFTAPANKMFSLTLFLKQNATGGYTVTSWSGGSGVTIKWDGGTAPSIATGAGKTTIIQLIKAYDEAVWYGSMVWKEL